MDDLTKQLFLPLVLTCSYIGCPLPMFSCLRQKKKKPAVSELTISTCEFVSFYFCFFLL